MSEMQIVELRKNAKRNKIIDTIRRKEQVSRFDVKKLTKYSMTTVLNCIEELIQNGLVYDVESTDVRVGRKPDWLKINPEGAYFIGCEFNAQKLHCVLVNFAGDVVMERESGLFYDIPLERILSMITDAIIDCLTSLGGKKERVVGIGIGVPGYCDAKKRVALHYPHLKHWANVPICDLLEQRFGLRTIMENNINAMAMAYKWLKFEGNAEDFVLVSVRSGVRLALVLDHKLYCGSDGLAGEIAHMKVGNSNRLCACGKRGCIDTEISEVAVENKLVEGVRVGRFAQYFESIDRDSGRVDIPSFIESVKLGHEDSVALMDETAENLGIVISQIVNFINPKRIVLSGALVYGDAFVKKVKNVIENNIPFIRERNLNVVRLKFNDNIAAVGAAILVLEDEFGAPDIEL